MAKTIDIDKILEQLLSVRNTPGKQVRYGYLQMWGEGGVMWSYGEGRARWEKEGGME